MVLIIDRNSHLIACLCCRHHQRQHLVDVGAGECRIDDVALLLPQGALRGDEPLAEKRIEKRGHELGLLVVSRLLAVYVGYQIRVQNHEARHLREKKVQTTRSTTRSLRNHFEYAAVAVSLTTCHGQRTYVTHELIVDGPEALAAVGGKREERRDLALGILASGEQAFDLHGVRGQVP